MQWKPQQQVSLAVPALHRFDDPLEAGPGRVDPIPAEVGQRRAGHASASRRREGERRDIADKDVDAVCLQEIRLGAGACLELAREGLPAAPSLVDVQLEAIVLRHAYVERPTRRRQELRLRWEQPGWGIGADLHTHTARQQRACHLGAAHRVAEAVARDGQADDGLRVACCALRVRRHLIRPSRRSRSLSAFKSSSMGSTGSRATRNAERATRFCGPSTPSTRRQTAGSSRSAP